MNINISAITNGWVVTVSVPKGQSAQYYKTFSEAVIALQEMKKEMDKDIAEQNKVAGN